jgi:signal transduction histidine kinase
MVIRHHRTRRRRYRAQAERAGTAECAASIAHEINNPLAAVTNLFFLIGNEEGSASSKIYVDLAQRELARVANIVTQTLRFHRQSTHARSTSLSEVLDSVVTLFQGKASNAGISIKKQYETEQPIVAFDGDLRQAFTNLLANSLDASETGGRVIIRVRESKDWATGENGVRVIFADAGHGMSPATKARIFEPFFTTKVSTGTGLGLWVTSEILQNHRARIHVRSSQSSKSSTVFSIFFPLNGLAPN